MISQFDKIIITAMDRFVWFILLVVMSHLVTEFSRVNGNTREKKNDVILMNDSVLMASSVPEEIIVQFPEQKTKLYESSDASEQVNIFSFRPLIDSFFEAVIRVLQHLTECHQHVRVSTSVRSLDSVNNGKHLLAKESLCREESAS